MFIQIKSFILPYWGASFEAFEDRIAINTDVNRFALADGVSQSYMSGLWAETLVESFVDSNLLPEDWDSLLKNEAFNELFDKWCKKEKDKLAQSDDVLACSYKRSEKRYSHTAYSTLAGCWLDGDVMHYSVIGDSCIFVTDQKKILQTISTVQDIGFTDLTSAISSSGQTEGVMAKGVVRLTPGIIFLMSDALSDWFLGQEDISEAINALWTINSHAEFSLFVERLLSSYSIHNDDFSIIMLKIVQGEGNEVITYDSLDAYLHNNKGKNSKVGINVTSFDKESISDDLSINMEIVKEKSELTCTEDNKEVDIGDNHGLSKENLTKETIIKTEIEESPEKMSLKEETVGEKCVVIIDEKDSFAGNDIKGTNKDEIKNGNMNSVQGPVLIEGPLTGNQNNSSSARELNTDAAESAITTDDSSENASRQKGQNDVQLFEHKDDRIAEDELNNKESKSNHYLRFFRSLFK